MLRLNLDLIYLRFIRLSVHFVLLYHFLRYLGILIELVHFLLQLLTPEVRPRQRKEQLGVHLHVELIFNDHLLVPQFIVLC